jgi:hypothetical protein
MLFHLEDSYFFLNELIKNQATSIEENDIFSKILSVLNLESSFLINFYLYFIYRKREEEIRGMGEL